MSDIVIGGRGGKTLLRDKVLRYSRPSGVIREAHTDENGNIVITKFDLRSASVPYDARRVDDLDAVQAAIRQVRDSDAVPTCVIVYENYIRDLNAKFKNRKMVKRLKSIAPKPKCKHYNFTWVNGSEGYCSDCDFII